MVSSLSLLLKYGKLGELKETVDDGHVRDRNVWKSLCKKAVSSQHQYIHAIHDLETLMFIKTKFIYTIRDTQIECVIWWKVSFKHLNSLYACMCTNSQAFD